VRLSTESITVSGMSDDLEKLLKDIMKLPAEARAALAGRLIESLDSRVDDDAEAAWGREVEARISEAESGKSRPISWADARRTILGVK
jgi:putative addiction module component (TIGR02574 family)